MIVDKMFPWERTYYDLCVERQQLAVEKFVDSGYNNHAANDEYLFWFEKIQDMLAKVRRRNVS